MLTNVHVYKVQNQSNAISLRTVILRIFLLLRIYTYTYMQSLLHAFSIKVIIIFIVSPSENVAAVTPNHTLPNLFHFKLCASLHYFFFSCSSCPHKSFVLGWVALMAATQAFPAPSLQHHLSLVGCSNAYIPALVFFTNIHWLWLSLMPMLLNSFFLPAFYTVWMHIFMHKLCMLTAVNMNKCARSIFFTSFLPSTIPIPTTSSQECMF